MRVFPFEIGLNVNHAILNELAKSTMSEMHFIKNGSNHEISDKVLSTLRSSYVGAIVNTQIHIKGINLFEITPHPIHSLFCDKLAHVIVRYVSIDQKSGQSVLINGECRYSSYEEAIAVQKNDRTIDLQKELDKYNEAQFPMLQTHQQVPILQQKYSINNKCNFVNRE